MVRLGSCLHTQYWGITYAAHGGAAIFAPSMSRFVALSGHGTIPSMTGSIDYPSDDSSEEQNHCETAPPCHIAAHPRVRMLYRFVTPVVSREIRYGVTIPEAPPKPLTKIMALVQDKQAFASTQQHTIHSGIIIAYESHCIQSTIIRAHSTTKEEFP
ncbi:MAG: hypothetical protein JSR31_00060 [Nitrospira sp.]|nr:hypothetical protein [Nitrospira sp.]